MDKSCRSQLAKSIGDHCGSLACFCVGFAIFVAVFSFFVSIYHVEVWAVVSVMVGIAFAALFTRIRLFLSYWQDCKPDDVFNPIFNYLIIFSLLGVVSGFGLSCVYNGYYTNEIFGVSCDDPSQSEEMLSRCNEYQHSVQQLLDYVLIAVPIYIVLGFVVSMKRRASQFTHGEQADNS